MLSHDQIYKLQRKLITEFEKDDSLFIRDWSRIFSETAIYGNWKKTINDILPLLEKLSKNKKYENWTSFVDLFVIEIAKIAPISEFYKDPMKSLLFGISIRTDWNTKKEYCKLIGCILLPEEAFKDLFEKDV